MKTPNEVVNVLANSRIDGFNLFLTDVQLDRKLYLSVNKVLNSLGGVWKRGVKAHVFPVSPADIIEELLQTGEYIDQKREYQFFETPDELAKRMIGLADIQSGESILEPSTGKAAIAKYLYDYGITCVEILESNREYLIEKGFSLGGRDFMDFQPTEKYDVIIANPPFSKQQDIIHINKMLDIASRVVVSVASASVTFRDNKRTVEFRERIERLGGKIEMLPDDTFISSGTRVRACLIVCPAVE